MKLLILTLCLAAVLAEEGEPEKLDATVVLQPLDKVAMQGSAYMNQYCSKTESKMPGEPYRSQFAPDFDQCLNRCNRDPLCSSADYSAEQTCNQHKEGGELVDASGWTHYRRRAKANPACPEGTTEHVNVPSPYSKTFCVYVDQKCPGNDLYKNSQNIADRDQCMVKCAKIKSCASAEFKDGKCDPKGYACSSEELVDEEGYVYMQRLEAGVEECVCVSGYARDTQGVCQRIPCYKSVKDISGVETATRDGKILIQRNAPCGTPGRITFDKSWADYKAGFGDAQNPDIGYWVGLDFLHSITNNAEGDRYMLIAELPHNNGNTYWAYYDNFVVSCEEEGYRLSVGAYSGNAGNALNKPTVFNGGTENGSPFSTFDADNDDWGDDNCAASFGAGWWFSSCFASHPNGPCPGEAKYKPQWSVKQAWNHVAWSGTGTLAGTYMMIQKVT